ncbi:MAG: nucleotidyltransferase family protein, partial [Pseudonocardia sp.]|nr:nucleotidyltransferase family protein [Pseudonocardia sp.]
MTRRLCGADEYPHGLTTIAGHLLPGAAGRWPAAPSTDGEWDALLAAAAAHRVTGLLVAAVGDGALPATAAQAGRARSGHRAAQLRVLGLEQQLVAVTDLLAAHGLGARVLKGPAVAHLDYPDPGLRSFGDLDVLVRSGEIDRVVAVLSAAGFRRTLSEPRPGFDRRFDKGLTMVPPAGYELDLHRTFVLGPWGRLLDLGALWRSGQDVVVAGTTLRALDRPHR